MNYLEGKEGSTIVAGVLLGVVVWFLYRNRRAKQNAARQEFLGDRKRCMGILLIGPPGSGKGTVSQGIQTQLHISGSFQQHQFQKIQQQQQNGGSSSSVIATGPPPQPPAVVDISIGDLLRENVRGNTKEGSEVQWMMSQGKMIPDRLLLEMLKKKLMAIVPARSIVSGGGADDDDEKLPEMCWILDGFPRTHEQANSLLDAKILPRHVLVLETDEERIIERIAGRRIDPVTNKSYHVKFAPPPADDPELISRLIQRKDDKEEIVRNRLKVYAKESAKIVSWFKALASTSRGKGIQVHFIDANESTEEVWASVQKAIPILKQIGSSKKRD